MKKYIGLCLIIIGLLITVINMVEWQMGRSAAEEMTKEEVKEYGQSKVTTKAMDREKTMKQNKEKAIYTKEQSYPSKSYPKNNNSQIASTEVSHEKGEKVASLIVPRIEQKYTVRWGAEEEVLKKGVGMFVSTWTTAPNGGGHTVISGHRDTVFYRMDELKEQDFLLLEYEDTLYTYQIEKIWITDQNDTSVIVKKDTPTLTITTCYPFNYVGNATQRYIIQAGLRGTEGKG